MKIDFASLYSGRDGDPRLARAFSWLARSGVGRKFGSLPIGWYQMHQCEGLDLIKERAQTAFPAVTAFDVRAKAGSVECRPATGGKWAVLGTVNELFNETDRRARA